VKAGELIALLKQCNPDVAIYFVNENGYLSDIEFVENRLKSSGWDAGTFLYTEKPDWRNAEDHEVEIISADYVFAITKCHDV
jgi:hypothetical protein